MNSAIERGLVHYKSGQIEPGGAHVVRTRGKVIKAAHLPVFFSSCRATRVSRLQHVWVDCGNGLM